MKKAKIVNNELFTDYKAVVHAADLIERDVVHPDALEILPIGGDKRAFSKDIAETEQYYSERRRQERVRISVNREGLYDMLPEGLFHRPPRGSSGMDEEGMIKDIKERREEEKEARLFFSPFDAELNHARLIAELYENKLDKKTTCPHLNQIFENSWEEFSLLNKEQSIIWMHLLPEIQSRRNDIPFVSQVLTALFNIPIQISDISNHIKPEPVAGDMQMELGKSDLGIDTIIGKDFMPDYEMLNISIGPALPGELVGFMPGKKNREIMDMALSYLVPLETEVQVDLLTDPDFQETTLSENGENAYLGFTVFL